MNYHGYTIRKADWRGYKVTTPKGETWIDIAPTLKIATKWIECDQAAERKL